MRYILLLEAFEIELNKLDDGLNKPSSSITEYFLNVGLDKFWKTRYSLNNYKREGFEQTEKRIDDLRTLIKKATFTTDINKIDNSLYVVELPEDYVILLGDRAGILPADGITNPCWELDDSGKYITHYSDTIEGTIETIDRIRENSLSEYHLKYTKAKPIRLIDNSNINLYTDGQYKVAEYEILYLRKPQHIDIHKDPFAEYTDMPEHTQIEIVKLAALLYLQNQADPRYLSYTQEIIPNME